MFHYTMNGMNNVYLDNGYVLHDNELGITKHGMLDKKIAEFLICHPKRLFGNEIRVIRTVLLKAGQRELTERFDLDLDRYRSLERSEKFVPISIDRAIRDICSSTFAFKKPSKLSRTKTNLRCFLDDEGWHVYVPT